MNKAEQKRLINNLRDSITVIKGNAQMAFESERPKWVNRYLSEINKETDKAEETLKKFEQLCTAECYNYSIHSGNTALQNAPVKIIWNAHPSMLK